MRAALRSAFGKVTEIFVRKEPADAALVSRLEASLLAADVGVTTTSHLIKQMNQNLSSFESGERARQFLKAEILEILKPTKPQQTTAQPITFVTSVQRKPSSRISPASSSPTVKPTLPPPPAAPPDAPAQNGNSTDRPAAATPAPPPPPPAEEFTTDSKPGVLLIVGVNGCGKTTTIGKLCSWYRQRGLSVVVAAGDTFRAAAVQQLQSWGEKTGATVVTSSGTQQQLSGRPSGNYGFQVAQEAVRRGIEEGANLVICDTAGRLHTKLHLMAELEGICTAVAKVLPGAPHHIWLVLDATNGQNALVQARAFQQKVKLSGLIVTKLDGSAKGGVVLSIAHELKIPIRFVGIGETMDDLRRFEPQSFVDAMFNEK